MSEEKRKLSAFEAFKQTQLSYAEAEEKAKSEAGAPKVERFRTGEDGDYAVRILPLAPSFDDQGNILPMDRKGYEYPIHQFFLTIKAPAKKGGKPKKLNIPVIRTTNKEVGYSVDLIDTYLRIAKEMYGDDEDLMKKLTSSSYDGGIRWNYQHAMMLLDISSDKERAKGPQLWQCSHSQYKDIDAAKMRLWQELREEDENAPCPISSFTDAYPVNIIRKTENKKTEYTIEIGRRKKEVKEEEAEKLLELPRIPEQIYRYTRYQMEATLVFLQQYDEDHGMEVCKEPDFIEAVETLKGELPADDTSHFSISAAASKETGKGEVTIESLWQEYDVIVDQDLNEKSSEYQDLREKIRQFIEDKDLDVRISRTKNNQQLLTEIEEALESRPAAPVEKEEEPAKPERRPAPKPTVEEEAEDEPEQGNDEEEAPAPRPRAARPGSAVPESQNEEPLGDEPEEKAPEVPAPERRERRARRLR